MTINPSFLLLLAIPTLAVGAFVIILLIVEALFGAINDAIH